MTWSVPVESTPPPPAPRPRDRPRYGRLDLEGLRAVAVVLVVLHQARFGLSGGYVGVDVLLVVSGYLVTHRLLREQDERMRISWAGFAARRARRLLPATSVVVIGTIAGSALLLGPSQIRAVAVDGLWTSVFALNHHLASADVNPLDPTSPVSALQHLWPISVAAQVFVGWLVVLSLGLMVADRRRGGRVALACGAAALVGLSLWWSTRETTSDPTDAFFSTFGRAWELGAGALLALCAPALARLPRALAAALGWVGLGTIVCAAVAFDTATSFPGWAAVVPVAGASAVVAAGVRPTRVGPGALLGTRLLVEVGACSFALYLWHHPLLTVVENKYPDLGGTARALLVGAAVVLAAASLHLFERPVARLRSLTRSTARSLVMGTACIGVVLLYAQMTVVGQDFVQEREEVLFDVQQRLASAGSIVQLPTADAIERAIAAAATLEVVPADVKPPVSLAHGDVSPAELDGCLAGPAAVASPPGCRYAVRESPETVVVFGDEQAVQWLPALIELADRQEFAVEVLTKTSCPVADVDVSEECGQWREWALGRMAELRPVVVVAGETSQSSDEAAWQAGLRATLGRLDQVTGSVVLLSQTPAHATSVPTCLTDSPRRVTTCAATPTAGAAAAHAAASRATAEAASARFVGVDGWLCSATACPTVIDGRIAVRDRALVTSTYAIYLSHVLGVATGLESVSQTTAVTGGATEAEVRAAVVAATEGRQPSLSITPPPNLAARDLPPVYSNGCLVIRPDTTSPPCEFGDLQSDEDVVLFGDSKAAQWLPALVSAATRNDFKLTVLTKANCPASLIAVWNFEVDRPFTECTEWRERAIARIESIRPELVVVSNSFRGVALVGSTEQSRATEEAFETGLVQVVQLLQLTGAEVAVVGDVPAHGRRIPECVQENEKSLSECSTPPDEAILTGHRLIEQEVIRQATTATYVDVAPWFCTPLACPGVINSMITAIDETHITATYSAHLSHVLAAAVGLEP